jgi:hypothetical protein
MFYVFGVEFFWNKHGFGPSEPWRLAKVVILCRWMLFDVWKEQQSCHRYVCAFILNNLFRLSPLSYKIVHQFINKHSVRNIKIKLLN